MNMMKVNESHDHAVCEKIKVLHYFRFAAQGFIFFLLIQFHIYYSSYVAIWYKFYSCNKLF